MNTCFFNFYFIIDGPNNVALSISGNHVSVTQGRQLGPITCSAVCYLECDYIWKRFKNEVFSTVIVGQNFTIHSATMDDSGSYICYVAHKKDTSRIGTTTMVISVEGRFDICKTFDKTSLTPALFIEVSVLSQESDWWCIWVLGVSILYLFLRIWYLILKLFRQFGIICFSFALFYAVMIYHRIYTKCATSWAGTVLFPQRIPSHPQRNTRALLHF